MRISINSRLAVDFALGVAVLVSFAFRLTGDIIHEWVGLTAAILFLLHNIVNAEWYAHIFYGKYKAGRTLNSAVDIALLITAVTVFITGLLQARHSINLGEQFGGMQMRRLHTTAAYWMLLLAFVHLGIHWKMILAKFGLAKKEHSGVRKVILRSLAVAAAFCGVWAFVQRDMYGKLFLGYSFDFWDETLPDIFILFQYAAISALFTCTGYILSKLFASVKNK